MRSEPPEVCGKVLLIPRAPFSSLGQLVGSVTVNYSKPQDCETETVLQGGQQYLSMPHLRCRCGF